MRFDFLMFQARPGEIAKDVELNRYFEGRAIKICN